MGEKENRVPLWDNLKFCLILLVVVGHFAEQGGTTHFFKSVFLFVYAFHMPAFFFVSGMFHSNKRVPQRVAAYLALYMLMKALIYIERLWIGQDPSFSLLKESGIPWFMFVMAAFTLVTYLFRDADKKGLLLFAVLLACFAGYDKNIGDSFVLSRILVFYPFYLAGQIIPQEKLAALRREKTFRWSAVLILLVWGLACLFLLDKVYALRPLFTGRNAYSESFLPYGAFWRLVCYAVSSVCIYAAVMLVPYKEIKPLTVFGRRTLQVYFWHRMVLYLLNYMGLPGKPLSLPVQIGWLCLGVLVTLVLSLKPFGFLTDYVMHFSKISESAGAPDTVLAEQTERIQSGTAAEQSKPFDASQALSRPANSEKDGKTAVQPKETERGKRKFGRVSVKVDDVSMKFSLSSEKVDSLKEYVIGKLSGKQMEKDEFWALKHVSFTLYEGDRLGILGLNGAGKSTLLKAIAGVYRPTEGKIKKKGVIAPLLELGAGFDMQYTARENIYLYGAVLGYNREFIDSRFDDIIKFAELEKFVDVPLKNYSSGMKSRLGFAICTAVEPDILILDEVLSVGDAKFRKKSEKRIMDMFSRNVTVLFVSHSIDQVSTICNKGLILDHGEVKAFGDIHTVVEAYKEMTS